MSNQRQIQNTYELFRFIFGRPVEPTFKAISRKIRVNAHLAPYTLSPRQMALRLQVAGDKRAAVAADVVITGVRFLSHDIIFSRKRIDRIRFYVHRIYVHAPQSALDAPRPWIKIIKYLQSYALRRDGVEINRVAYTRTLSCDRRNCYNAKFGNRPVNTHTPRCLDSNFITRDFMTVAWRHNRYSYHYDNNNALCCWTVFSRFVSFVEKIICFFFFAWGSEDRKRRTGLLFLPTRKENCILIQLVFVSLAF